MHKTDPQDKSPIDQIYYFFVHITEKYFKKLNFTPNMITTIGNIFGIMGLYYLNKKHFPLATFLFLMRYYFDCVDGFYARKYNMVTVFGDYYDHIGDIVIILLNILLLYKVNNKIFTKVNIAITLFMTYMVMVYLYYQEYYYSDNNNDKAPMLKLINYFIPNILRIKDKSQYETNMKYLKYFGCGTHIFMIAIFILLGHFN